MLRPTAGFGLALRVLWSTCALPTPCTLANQLTRLTICRHTERSCVKLPVIRQVKCICPTSSSPRHGWKLQQGLTLPSCPADLCSGQLLVGEAGDACVQHPERNERAALGREQDGAPQRCRTLQRLQAGAGCGGAAPHRDAGHLASRWDVWGMRPLHNTAVEGGFTDTGMWAVMQPYRFHPPLVGGGPYAPLTGDCAMLAVQRHVEALIITQAGEARQA